MKRLFATRSVKLFQRAPVDSLCDTELSITLNDFSSEAESRGLKVGEGYWNNKVLKV